MPTILGANTLSTGYDVENSVMLDDGDSAYLSKTDYSSDGTSHDVGTVSFWVKRGELDAEQGIITAGASNRHFIRFESNNTFTFRAVTDSFHLNTNRLFRDPTAWYHFVVAFDTTQGTASNRVKIYVNGSQITSFGTSDYPDQNLDIKIGANEHHNIGRDVEQTNPYFDGYMAEFVYIDGQQLDADSFGEFDSDTPNVWRPKKVSTLTFGTNGFYLEFKVPGNIGLDTSGNSHNFDGNNLQQKDQAQDTCTNNFCVWNPLNFSSANTNLSQGNTKIVGGSQSSPNYTYVAGTLAVSSGKWYWEAKALDNAEIDQAGVSKAELSNFAQLSSSGGLQATTHGGKSIQFSNGVKAGDGSQSTYMGGFSADDILMVALDMDNGNIYFGRNGNWADGSGNADQAFGSASAAFTNLDTGEFYHPAHTMRDSAGNNSGSVAYNFGGAFNENFANAVETDANGFGHFEYAVPSGYFALCTKNIAENG